MADFRFNGKVALNYRWDKPFRGIHKRHITVKCGAICTFSFTVHFFVSNNNRGKVGGTLPQVQVSLSSDGVF